MKLANLFEEKTLELMNFTEAADEDVLLDVLKSGDYVLNFNGIGLYDESLDTLPLESCPMNDNEVISEHEFKRIFNTCRNVETEEGLYDVRLKVLLTTVVFEFTGGLRESYTLKVIPIPRSKRKFTMTCIKQNLPFRQTKVKKTLDMIDLCDLLHKRVYG